MKRAFYACIFILIFIETALNSNYPYYAIAVSFTGYLAYKKEYHAMIYAALIGALIGISGSHLIRDISFFVMLVFVMIHVYKLFYFEKINIIIISFIECVIYVCYVYLFKINEVQIISWVKEFGFLVVYSYLFSSIDKNIGK